ncbi:hypothetical protein GGX14DRAFT_392599 [Mycena pura]|uniref:Uncharacterized protein n=1 Tax=Mycena pura TaxID=153505 RepID=A0AAD6VKD0_9AGAR|nr:hypothetical protein GGX14DRAFT_392599 [Mycena pura]
MGLWSSGGRINCLRVYCTRRGWNMQDHRPQGCIRPQRVSPALPALYHSITIQEFATSLCWLSVVFLLSADDGWYLTAIELAQVGHYGIRPNVVLPGKALSGGLCRVPAVLTNRDIMLRVKLGCTYGGPVHFPLFSSIRCPFIPSLLDIKSFRRLHPVRLEILCITLSILLSSPFSPSPFATIIRAMVTIYHVYRNLPLPPFAHRSPHAYRLPFRSLSSATRVALTALQVFVNTDCTCRRPRRGPPRVYPHAAGCYRQGDVPALAGTARSRFDFVMERWCGTAGAGLLAGAAVDTNAVGLHNGRGSSLCGLYASTDAFDISVDVVDSARHAPRSLLDTARCACALFTSSGKAVDASNLVEKTYTSLSFCFPGRPEDIVY